MKKLLIVEDDQDLGIMLKHYLVENDFSVNCFVDGKLALEWLQKNNVDLCIFDVMMPELDGFSLAKQVVKFKPELPFIFLTARIATEDKLVGLKLGADDYIEKPFEAEELVYRIKNIIKRTNQIAQLNHKKIAHDIYQIGQFKFDFENLTISINNESKKITTVEARLLYYLQRNRNQLIKREDILGNVWGKTDFFTGRSMDVFISRIRKYLKADPMITIKSVRGIGLEFKVKK